MLGGGPAGAAASLLLSTWGHAVHLITRPSDDHGLAVSLPPSCAKLFDAIGVSDAIARAAMQAIHTGHEAVLGHRCQSDGGGLIVLHNFSRKPATVDVSSGLSGEGVLKDLVSGEEFTFQDGQVQITLPGYGYVWGQLERSTPGV